MKRFILVGVLMVPIGLASCSGERTRAGDHITKKEKIVFNKRSADQIRGQVERANNTQPRSATEHNRMRAALLTRGTGILRVRSWRDESDENDDDQHDCDDTARSLASGFMTSDTRMITAHHAVPALRTSGLEDEDNALLVSFDGDYGSDGTKPVDEPWSAVSFESEYPSDVARANGNGNWYLDNNESDSPATKLDEVIKNPLLPNRLFALGLRKWAEDSNWNAPSDNRRKLGMMTRKALSKHWPFAIDATREEQSAAFSEGNGTGCDRLDIMVLRARENEKVLISTDPENIHYLQSGPFEIFKPAVFFQSMPFRNIVDDPCAGPNSETPLYLSHSTYWPDDDNTQSVPLVSNPGYADGMQSMESVQSSSYCPEQGSGAEVECTYRKLIRTTLDARPGSSGGAMHSIVRDTVDGSCTRGYREQIKPSGVLHGVDVLESDEERNSGWGLPFYTGSQEPEQPTPDYATRVTAATSKVEEWSKRDKDFDMGDPTNPKPNQPPVGQQLDCAEQNSDDECIRYHTYRPVPAGSSGTPRIYTDVPDESPTPNDEEGSGEFVRRICGYRGNLKWPVRAGLATGLLGAATEPYDTEDTGVVLRSTQFDAHVADFMQAA